MISKYKNANKELKEYKAKRVKQGTAKNGKPFTVFNVSDKVTKEDGSSVYENYSVFSWQEGIKLADDDKITFNDITALEVNEREYNGKTYIDKTIFADINVISANPNQVDVVGDLPDFAEPTESDGLPF